MALPRRVSTILTRLEKEEKISKKEANRIREKYEIKDEELERTLNLVDSTGIPIDAASYFLRKGFSEVQIVEISEIADKYGINKRTVRASVYEFIKRGVPLRDVTGLMEIREMLRRGPFGISYATPPSLHFDLTTSTYLLLGGLEELRQYTKFILDNEELINSALPGKISDADTPRIQWLSAWLTYELSGRNPEKTREKLEQLVESYIRTS